MILNGIIKKYFSKKVFFHLKTIFLIFLLLLSLVASSGCIDNSSVSIRVSGAWALYPMMLVWADEYEKTHDVTVEVSGGGAGKGMSDVLNGQVDIGMISRPIQEEEIAQGAFYVAVAKDAVVATINSNNPVLVEIYEQGLSKNDLRNIFLKKTTHWGDIVNKTISDDEIVVYGRSDASGAAKIWASYLGDYTQSDMQNKADANFNGDQPLAQAVKEDKNAIGFNNLNYAYNIETGSFADGIRPIPLDLDGDDSLEKSENFYGKRSALVENVSLGNYPSPPARKEYLAAKGSFKGATKEFVYWILTDGQEFITENGYVTLSDDTIEQEIEYLNMGTRN